MKVSDIMTSSVHSIDANQSGTDAWELMNQHEIRHVPVTRDGKVVGVVSQRDFAAVASTFGLMEAGRQMYEGYLDRPVHVLLKTRYTAGDDVFALHESRPLLHALEVFIEYGFSALPVVDDQDRLVGIVSYIDLLKSYRDSLS